MTSDDNLDSVARDIRAATGAGVSPVTLVFLRERLYAVQPFIPFDLEPNTMGEPPIYHTISQVEEAFALKSAYDDVRLWFSLRDQLALLK